MTPSSFFIICSHGRRSAHGFGTGQTADVPWHVEEWCPGGRPVTLEDIEELGDKVWWCRRFGKVAQKRVGYCFDDNHAGCGWRILLPLPQMVAE